MHTKCCHGSYPRTNNEINRSAVPRDKIDWQVSFPEYKPVSYTSPIILSLPPYADPDLSDSTFAPIWNTWDEKIDRQSHECQYDIINGIPRNYKGRTGIAGRGCLGRWGPNHAADPIVTRWKYDKSGNKIIDEDTKKSILQFVGIQRRDGGEWALPGGMVDPGEKVSSTVQREFMEEALNSLMMSNEEKQKAKQELQSLFDGGVNVYSGYVDDPRNSDNAWMETVAFHFHEDSPTGILSQLKLNAGDDAKAVKWIDVDGELKLYASHRSLLEKAVVRVDAHWIVTIGSIVESLAVRIAQLSVSNRLILDLRSCGSLGLEEILKRQLWHQSY